MGESKRLIKNTGIIAVGGMATKLVSFFLLPLYTTVLSTAEYGTVDYVNTIAIFCIPVVSLLMDEAVFRFLLDCDTDDERSRVISVSCVIMLFGCLVFFGCSALVSLFLHPKNTAWVLALVASGALLQMASALLRGFGDTTGYALMNFIASAMTIILNVIFIAVLRLGVVGMLAASTLAHGTIAIAFLISKRFWRFIKPDAIDRNSVIAFLKYSIPLIPNKVSWTIMNLLDRIVIMNAIGADAAGVYAVAYKFPNLMDQVYGFFYQSWKESSARVLNSDENNESFYNSVYQVLRRFLMGVVLGVTALIPFVYAILIRGPFDEGLRYIPILLLATFFSNMSGFYGGIFTAHKDTAIMGTSTIASAGICVVLCFLLIPTFGLYGSSVATLASTFIVNEYRRAKVKKYAQLCENRLEQAVTFLCCVVVFFLYYLHIYSGSFFAEICCMVSAVGFFFVANRSMIARIANYVRTSRRKDFQHD